MEPYVCSTLPDLSQLINKGLLVPALLFRLAEGVVLFSKYDQSNAIPKELPNSITTSYGNMLSGTEVYDVYNNTTIYFLYAVGFILSNYFELVIVWYTYEFFKY